MEITEDILSNIAIESYLAADIATTEDVIIDVEGYLAPDEDFAIHLLPGWNMIGTPFNFSVDWKGVQVSYNDTTVSILEAHDNGWVTKFFYSYDMETGGFIVETVSDGQLDPWQGYWVKALVECDLIIPNEPSVTELIEEPPLDELDEEEARLAERGCGFLPSAIDLRFSLFRRRLWRILFGA